MKGVRLAKNVDSENVRLAELKKVSAATVPSCIPLILPLFLDACAQQTAKKTEETQVTRLKLYFYSKKH